MAARRPGGAVRQAGPPRRDRRQRLRCRGAGADLHPLRHLGREAGRLPDRADRRAHRLLPRRAVPGARDRLVRDFQAGTGAGALVLSLKAGGTGLNLTAANHVVLYDRWWNPAVEDQARDRAWRIGQRNTVICHRLVCPGTVDERVEEVVAGKRRIADLVLPKASTIADLDGASCGRRWASGPMPCSPMSSPPTRWVRSTTGRPREPAPAPSFRVAGRAATFVGWACVLGCRRRAASRAPGGGPDRAPERARRVAGRAAVPRWEGRGALLRRGLRPAQPHSRSRTRYSSRAHGDDPPPPEADEDLSDPSPGLR